MLTGDPPHWARSAQQIIMKIVTEEAALGHEAPEDGAAARRGGGGQVAGEAAGRSLRDGGGVRRRRWRDGAPDSDGPPRRARRATPRVRRGGGGWRSPRGGTRLSPPRRAPGGSGSAPDRSRRSTRFGLAFPDDQRPEPGSGFSMSRDGGGSSTGVPRSPPGRAADLGEAARSRGRLSAGGYRRRRRAGRLARWAPDGVHSAATSSERSPPPAGPR